MKKKKIIISIFCIILILLVLLASKLFMMKKISNKLDEFDKVKNVHATIKYYDEKSLLINHIWLDKDNNRVLHKMINFVYENEDKEDILYTYRDEKVSKEYSENSEDEIALISEDEIEDNKTENSDETYAFNNAIVSEVKPYLKNIFSYSISNTTINGIECYKIKGRFDDKLIFIDKNTGAVVREIKKVDKFDEVIDYTYDFNSVTDETFEFLEEVN